MVGGGSSILKITIVALHNIFKVSLNETEQRLTMHNATKPNKIKMNRLKKDNDIDYDHHNLPFNYFYGKRGIC